MSRIQIHRQANVSETFVKWLTSYGPVKHLACRLLESKCGSFESTLRENYPGFSDDEHNELVAMINDQAGHLSLYSRWNLLNTAHAAHRKYIASLHAPEFKTDQWLLQHEYQAFPGFYHRGYSFTMCIQAGTRFDSAISATSHNPGGYKAIALQDAVIAVCDALTRKMKDEQAMLMAELVDAGLVNDKEVE